MKPQDKKVQSEDVISKINFVVLGKVWKTIYWFIVIAVLLITAGTAFSVYKTPGGYRMFVVLSGSMEPKIKTGSIVLVAKQDNYIVNDVVTFARDPFESLKSLKSTTTHRIVEQVDIEGGMRYRTKGDANEDPDLELVPRNQILGKVVFQIPWFGRVLAFAKTQLGFTVLIVIPGTLLVYNEILNIKQEIIRMTKKEKPKIKEER